MWIKTVNIYISIVIFLIIILSKYVFAFCKKIKKIWIWNILWFKQKAKIVLLFDKIINNWYLFNPFRNVLTKIGWKVTKTEHIFSTV